MLLRWKVSRHYSSQPVFTSFYSFFTYLCIWSFVFKYFSRLCMCKLFHLSSGMQFSGWPLCGVSLQVLTQTRRAAARTCSVVSGPAVALESDPAEQPTLLKCHVSFLLHFILGIPVAVLCHLKVFLEWNCNSAPVISTSIYIEWK